MQISTKNFGKQWPILIQDIKKNYDKITITEDGKPIAILLPSIQKGYKKSKFGCMKGTVNIIGDIIDPIGEEWNVER
ncbi:Antitoxin [Candidatus Magnetomoraceae bacterium gMMP-15]